MSMEKLAPTSEGEILTSWQSVRILATVVMPLFPFTAKEASYLDECKYWTWRSRNCVQSSDRLSTYNSLWIAPFGLVNNQVGYGGCVFSATCQHVGSVLVDHILRWIFEVVNKIRKRWRNIVCMEEHCLHAHSFSRFRIIVNIFSSFKCQQKESFTFCRIDGFIPMGTVQTSHTSVTNKEVIPSMLPTETSQFYSLENCLCTYF